MKFPCCALFFLAIAVFLRFLAPCVFDPGGFVPNPPLPNSQLETKRVRIACIGDSITAGRPFGTPWPDQLQTLLGSKYYVMNFGHGGAYARKLGRHENRSSKSDPENSLLTFGPGSYWNSQAFKYASDSQPDIVTIMLGTNDGCSPSWSECGGEMTFEADYRSLLQHFKELKSHPKIITMLPPPLYEHGAWFGMNQTLINGIIPPIIVRVSQDSGFGDPVDVPSSFLQYCPDLGHNSCHLIWKWFVRFLISDGVHPNTDGLALIAEIVRNRILKDLGHLRLA